MTKTVTIIDTFGFFFRSFYALPQHLKNKDGFPTGLLTGFTNFISTLQREHDSDYIIFAIDTKGPTFRNDIDPNYKANRYWSTEISEQAFLFLRWDGNHTPTNFRYLFGYFSTVWPSIYRENMFEAKCIISACKKIGVNNLQYSPSYKMR